MGERRDPTALYLMSLMSDASAKRIYKKSHLLTKSASEKRKANIPVSYILPHPTDRVKRYFDMGTQKAVNMAP